MNYGRTHEVKIDECYFKNVVSGRKRFEIRYDDRDYQVGDWLILCCESTGQRINCKIIYKSPSNRRMGTVFLALPSRENNDNI